MARVTELYVNGSRQRVEPVPEKPLLVALREDLGLVGAKPGCGEGVCGACTVLVDGRPVRSCVTPVGAVVGKHVLTIEGLEENDELHPLQQAFLDTGALQCGYCTPGMIMSGIGLLQQNPAPSEAEIVSFMQGNLCRCGCYPRILRAIQQAAKALPATTASGGVR